MSRNIALITGGGLQNRGAQAMLFNTIAEINKLFPELEPVLVSSDDAPQSLYNKLRGRGNRHDLYNLKFRIIWGEIEYFYDGTTFDIENIQRPSILKQIYHKKEIETINTTLNSAAICFDISGFAFGSQWGYNACCRYLMKIETLKNRGIPTYLLPQSFGPFVFPDKVRSKRFISAARELLEYPRMICAREQQGYKDLIKLCPDARCMMEEDLVIQCGMIDVSKIFYNPSQIQEYSQIITLRNVAIVPNRRTFEHGDETRLIALYGLMIEELLDDGYNVYVVRHSEDDDEACEILKGMFEDDQRVVLMSEERYCFQYEELFARCDFLVASRFHSIVHAYRRGVPCVALGWATKYGELLGRFGQGRYVHDVRSLGDTETHEVFASVKRMECHHAEESEVIKERLCEIRLGTTVFERVACDFAGLGR